MKTGNQGTFSRGAGAPGATDRHGYCRTYCSSDWIEEALVSISAFASAARHRRTFMFPAMLCIAAAGIAHGGAPNPASGPAYAVTSQDIVPPKPDEGEP